MLKDALLKYKELQKICFNAHTFWHLSHFPETFYMIGKSKKNKINKTCWPEITTIK